MATGVMYARPSDIALDVHAPVALSKMSRRSDSALQPTPPAITNFSATETTAMPSARLCASLAVDQV